MPVTVPAECVEIIASDVTTTRAASKRASRKLCRIPLRLRGFGASESAPPPHRFLGGRRSRGIPVCSSASLAKLERSTLCVAGGPGMEYTSRLAGSSPPSQGAEKGGVGGRVLEPTSDHVALDVSEGRELQRLPVDDGGDRDSHSHSRGEKSDDTVRGNGERQTSGVRGADQKAKKVENLAEIQIRGLLWLEQPGNEVYAKAHQTWEAQDALFASRIDKKKKQSNSLRNELYQLFGFYSVFQGVLLTAVAQSSYLHCHNWWTAFFLSLLASVVAIGGIIQKFIAILALEKTIKNEADTRQECINRVGRLLRKRHDFDFDVDARDGKPRGLDLTKLRVTILIVFVLLIFFSGLFLASIYQVLCDPGSASSSS